MFNYIFLLDAQNYHHRQNPHKTIKLLVNLVLISLFFVLPVVLPINVYADVKQNKQNIFDQLTAQDDIVVSNKNSKSVYKTYPLSNIRRISNQVKAKQEITIFGEITSSTTQIDPNQKLQNAFTNLRHALNDDYTTIMWCENRDCGSSALWANSVFSNPELTGIDDAQSYMFLQKHNLADEQKPNYLAVYGVTRGNQKSYIHIDEIRSAGYPRLLPTPNTLLKILHNLEFIILPADFNAGYFALIDQLLRENRNLHLLISSSNIDLWRINLAKLNSPNLRFHLQVLKDYHANDAHIIQTINGTALLNKLNDIDDYTYDLPANFASSNVWFEAVKQMLANNPNLKIKIIGSNEQLWKTKLNALNVKINRIQFIFNNQHNSIQLTN